jgi:F-type H+-transporting ATPase subunit b
MKYRALATTAVLLAVALVLLVAALPAVAADDGHGGGGREFFFQTLNLAILLGVVVYFARKPLMSFFADRRAQIKGDVDQAAGLLHDAETRYAEWQRRLIDLDSESETIRSDGRRRAEEEAQGILAEAQAAAERIHRGAEAAVEQELRRAQARLRDEAASLATELAERILKEQLGGADKERLMDEFITRVEPQSNRSSGS